MSVQWRWENPYVNFVYRIHQQRAVGPTLLYRPRVWISPLIVFGKEV